MQVEVCLDKDIFSDERQYVICLDGKVFFDETEIVCDFVKAETIFEGFCECISVHMQVIQFVLMYCPEGRWFIVSRAVCIFWKKNIFVNKFKGDVVCIVRLIHFGNVNHETV